MYKKLIEMFKSNLSVDHVVDVDILAVGLEHTPDINGFNLTINTIVNGIIDNLLITGFDKISIKKATIVTSSYRLTQI